MSALHEELESIELKPGDIIIDHMAGYVGVLIKRERRIDIVQDDMYFWQIRWSTAFPKSKKARKHKKELNILGYIEEDTLKLSILVGATEKYSSDDP
jgi:hypothetical protein